MLGAERVNAFIHEHLHVADLLVPAEGPTDPHSEEPGGTTLCPLSPTDRGGHTVLGSG